MNDFKRDTFELKIGNYVGNKVSGIFPVIGFLIRLVIIVIVAGSIISIPVAAIKYLFFG